MSANLARNETFTLNIYLDINQKAVGYLYLDDGETFNHQRSKDFALIRFEYEQGKLSVKLEEGNFKTENDVIQTITVIGVDSFGNIANNASIKSQSEGENDP